LTSITDQLIFHVNQFQNDFCFILSIHDCTIPTTTSTNVVSIEQKIFLQKNPLLFFFCNVSYHQQQQHQPQLIQQQVPLQQTHHMIPSSQTQNHQPKEMHKPKGRMSAYTFFVQKCRDEHRKAYPNENANFSEFSKKCAEKWKVTNPFVFLFFLNQYFDFIL
jgi:hypothetical protein